VLYKPADWEWSPEIKHMFLVTEEWNEIYLLSLGFVFLDVSGNTRLFSVHIQYITNHQHLSCTVYSVVKGSNHIWSILYKKYFRFSISSPLLTLAPFFLHGFCTCIVIGTEILINFKFCNLGTTDYCLMSHFLIYM